jgi:hypothetical protein
MKVKLNGGLTLEVKDNVLDNMELLDDLVDFDNGNGYAISRILARILEPEEKKKLYEHLRKDGVTSISDVTQALKELFDKLGPAGKN